MPETKTDENGAVIECWHSPAELLEIVSNIKDIRLGSASEVEILWKNESDWCVATEYWYGSFTRCLFDLMEGHLNKEKNFIGIEE